MRENYNLSGTVFPGYLALSNKGIMGTTSPQL
jgi:hypothetical protein